MSLLKQTILETGTAGGYIVLAPVAIVYAVSSLHLPVYYVSLNLTWFNIVVDTKLVSGTAKYRTRVQKTAH